MPPGKLNGAGKMAGFRVKQAESQIQAQPLISCVTLGRLLTSLSSSLTL
jgi:hypothetical protein